MTSERKTGDSLVTLIENELDNFGNLCELTGLYGAANNSDAYEENRNLGLASAGEILGAVRELARMKETAKVNMQDHDEEVRKVVAPEGSPYDTDGGAWLADTAYEAIGYASADQVLSHPESPSSERRGARVTDASVLNEGDLVDLWYADDEPAEYGAVLERGESYPGSGWEQLRVGRYAFIPGEVADGKDLRLVKSARPESLPLGTRIEAKVGILEPLVRTLTRVATERGTRIWETDDGIVYATHEITDHEVLELGEES